MQNDLNIGLYLCSNQRTYGPVNAHLTPSPGIYFNAFIYIYIYIYIHIYIYIYIASGQGQTTPWRQILILTESPYHFAHLLHVSNKSLWILILNKFLMFFKMYIAPGQGQTTVCGQNPDVNRKA